MNDMNTSYRDSDSFLNAWIRGVDLAGQQWFLIGDIVGAKIEGRPITKWHYRPDFDAINRNLGVLSSTEAAFLASMYSFYNPTDGGKMLKSLGMYSPGRLASVLDEPRLRVLADLMVSYEGW